VEWAIDREQLKAHLDSALQLVAAEACLSANSEKYPKNIKSNSSCLYKLIEFIYHKPKNKGNDFASFTIFNNFDKHIKKEVRLTF